jgi:hypothetical protein
MVVAAGVALVGLVVIGVSPVPGIRRLDRAAAQVGGS